MRIKLFIYIILRWYQGTNDDEAGRFPKLHQMLIIIVYIRILNEIRQSNIFPTTIAISDEDNIIIGNSRNGHQSLAPFFGWYHQADWISRNLESPLLKIVKPLRIGNYTINECDLIMDKIRKLDIISN